MSSEPKEGLYTYTVEGKTGKVRLEGHKSPKGTFWVIHYDQGWNPHGDAPGFGEPGQPKFELLDEGPYTNELITTGRLKLVKESFAPTPVKAGRRRSRRKTRARKSRRYRK